MSANFLCDQSIRCPCIVDPVTNFSSEDPDGPVFIANVDWGDPPPLNQYFTDPFCLGICTSTISQEDADLCALRAAELCVFGGYDTPGNPSYPAYARSNRPVFGNMEQNCTIECVDGTMHTEIVEAGTVLALTQVEADEKAHALACKRAAAKTVCFITDAALENGCVGTAYSISFKAQGGTAPYQYVQNGGSLPTGLALSADGELFGVPTSTGPFSFIITVTDDIGTTQTKTFNLTIVGITTVSLADGTVGVIYGAPLSESGAAAPLIWLLSAGLLPPGLSLSTGGVISGTPTAGGDYSFTVSLEGFGQTPCSKDFTIHVTNPTGAPDEVFGSVGIYGGHAAGNAHGSFSLPAGTNLVIAFIYTHSPSGYKTIATPTADFVNPFTPITVVQSLQAGIYQVAGAYYYKPGVINNFQAIFSGASDWQAFLVPIINANLLNPIAAFNSTTGTTDPASITIPGPLALSFVGITGFMPFVPNYSTHQEAGDQSSATTFDNMGGATWNYPVALPPKAWVCLGLKIQ